MTREELHQNFRKEFPYLEKEYLQELDMWDNDVNELSHYLLISNVLNPYIREQLELKNTQNLQKVFNSLERITHLEPNHLDTNIEQDVFYTLESFSDEELLYFKANFAGQKTREIIDDVIRCWSGFDESWKNMRKNSKNKIHTIRNQDEIPKHILKEAYIFSFDGGTIKNLFDFMLLSIEGLKLEQERFTQILEKINNTDDEKELEGYLENFTSDWREAMKRLRVLRTMGYKEVALIIQNADKFLDKQQMNLFRESFEDENGFINFLESWGVNLNIYLIAEKINHKFWHNLINMFR